MLRRLRTAVAATVVAGGVRGVAADDGAQSVMALNLGTEYFKVAEVVDRSTNMALNRESKRKTRVAVSVGGDTRKFGDSAVANQNKQDVGAFTYFNRLLGQTYADCGEHETDVSKCLEPALGLNADYYSSYQLVKNETRQTYELLTDKGKKESMPIELIMANVLQHARDMVLENNDNILCRAVQCFAPGGSGPLPLNDFLPPGPCTKKPIRDAVITIPTSWNQRQRQALLDSAKIAGLNSILIHETPSAAVNLAMDWQKEITENILFYNMGARSTEVCIAEFSPRQAGMVKGRTSPQIAMKACVHDERIGGHFGDIAIAEEMKKRFIKKHPKLASIESHPRALRKLLTQAQKSRHQLSAGKESFFSVEGLYEDTDFSSKLSRADFEELLKPMWEILTEPVEKALEKAGLAFKDLDAMEVVGMAWRMPKVQEVLNDYFKKEQETRMGKDPLALGQHLNGDETFTFGAGLFAANSSRAIRPMKKVFFQDTTHNHNYTVDLISNADGTAIKNTTEVAVLGSRLGVKKKITVNDAKVDFTVKLFENEKLISTWTVTGLEAAIEKDYAEMLKNATTKPKVAFTLGPDTSGVIMLSKKVEALFIEEFEEEVVDEEAMQARRKRKLEKERKAKKNATNSTENETNATDAASNETTSEEKKDEETKDEEKKEDAEKKDEEKTDDKSDEEKKDDEKKDEEKKEEVEKTEESTEDETKKVDEEKKEEDSEQKDGEEKKDGEDAKDGDSNSTKKVEGEEEDDDDDKPIMKKRLKKKNHIISLKVDRWDEFPKPMTPEEITQAQDLLFKMVKHDNEKEEMEETKNDLESFFYEVREKFDYNEVYKAVTLEEQRNELLNKVQETETWTEDEITRETTLAEIKEKLKALQELWTPIKQRAIEADSRADFIILMDKEVRKIEELKTKVKDNMPWLKAEEVEKALKKTDDFLADWEKKKEEQKEKPGHEEPVFTKSQIEGYAERSFSELRRLSKVKKPKERKDKNKGRGTGKKAAKDPRTAEQLAEELKKVTEELETLKTKKMEAVTNEDYDLADKLKTEEKAKTKALDDIYAAVEALKKAEEEKASAGEKEQAEKKDEKETVDGAGGEKSDEMKDSEASAQKTEEKKEETPAKKTTAETDSASTEQKTDSDTKEEKPSEETDAKPSEDNKKPAEDADKPEL